MNIILQETDPAILEIIKYAAEQAHFSVYAVLELERNYLKMIEKPRPHVIMLDYRPDGTSCLDICQHIKTRYPHLPVIAMNCNYTSMTFMTV
jgi:DNA-binding response OmpR family regulator